MPTLSSVELASERRTSRLTPGAVLAWLLFSLIALAVAAAALPDTGLLYDFRAFYASGSLLLHNPHHLFDLSTQTAVQNAVVGPMWPVPFYHPAYEAILYAVFNLLPYKAAYFTYVGCNLLLLGACYLLAPPISDPFLKKVPAAAFFFLAFPALICVAEGQDSIVFLFLLCLIWRKLIQGNDTAAGILLALVLFKLQITLSLALLIALSLPLRRARRLLSGFLPTATALALLCVAIVGISGTAQWIRLLGSAAVASHLGPQAQLTVRAVPLSMPSLNGLLYFCGTRFLSSHSALAMDIIGSVLVLCAALLLILRAPTLPVAFSAAILVSLLLAPHLFFYDYLPVILPLMLLKGRPLGLIAAFYYLAPILLISIAKLGWTALMAVVPLAILTMIYRELQPLRTNVFHSERPEVLGLREEICESVLER